MRSLKNVSTPSAFAGVGLILALLVHPDAPVVVAQKPVILRASDEDARRTSTSKVSTDSDVAPQSDLFFPLTPGTWWLYRGTVEWFDFDTGKRATTNASIKMQVEKVMQKPEFTLAVISGFPGDLDWSNGHVDPKPLLLIETSRHEIFLDEIPPDFDYSKLASKLEKEAPFLDKILSEDNLLFRWPLKKGMKFGDAESVHRPDDRYCWVVATQRREILKAIKGVPPKPLEVFLLQYVTNPEDTQMELSPGIGIISYQYHHHGSIADTSLALVEFHPAQPPAASSGAKP